MKKESQNQLAEERCPLCSGNRIKHLYKGDKGSLCRDFLHCVTCDLVFVPRSQHLTSNEERQRYAQHKNNPHDEGYRRFLGKLYEAVKPKITHQMIGLDYGSGPQPALSIMMEEDGFHIKPYDPFFSPNIEWLNKQYDYIMCSEVAEHFHNPIEEFKRLNDLLKKGGYLGLMTGMLKDWAQFPSWHYHRDGTHVVFYSMKTMGWIAEKFGWDYEHPRENVVLFHKKTNSRVQYL